MVIATHALKPDRDAAATTITRTPNAFRLSALK
jgi:hypothetical protein